MRIGYVVHEALDLSCKNLPPLKWFPQNRYFEIFGPPELIVQEDVEIFGLPVKYLDSQVNMYSFKTLLV